MRPILSLAGIAFLAIPLLCAPAHAVEHPAFSFPARDAIVMEHGDAPDSDTSAQKRNAPVPCDPAVNPVVLGANAVIKHGYEGKHSGWVNLEPGSRPAYVGIHGGTAPVSLLRSPGGSLFGYTGNTGNDFMHVLRGKNLAEDANPPEGAKEMLSLPQDTPAVFSSDEEAQQPPEEPSGQLQPFGLSNPENVVLVVQAKAVEEEEKPLERPAKRRPKHKRLKLGSYMSILSQTGNL